MIIAYKPICCARCQTEFQPLSGRAKFCPTCRPEVIREQVRKAVRAWRQAHPEQDREQRRKRREKQKEAKS